MTLSKLPPICDPDKHQKSDYVKTMDPLIYTCYVCGMCQTGDGPWWSPDDDARRHGIGMGKDGGYKPLSEQAVKEFVKSVKDDLKREEEYYTPLKMRELMDWWKDGLP